MRGVLSGNRYALAARQIGVSGGSTAADESTFTAWLMGRIWIPGG
jgi:hypothetical protein